MRSFLSQENYERTQKGNIRILPNGRAICKSRFKGGRYWIRKLFWSVSFLLSLFAAVHMIVEMWKDYRDNPLITIFNPRDVPIGILPFPSVTICNNNNVQHSKLKKYVRDAMKPNLTDEELSSAYSNLNNINHICRSARTFTERLLSTEYHPFKLDEKLKAEMIKRNLDIDANAPDPTRVLREVSQSCEGMIVYCIWMDEVEKCSDLFHEIETDYGYCCSFNLIPLTLLLRLRNDSRDKEPELSMWRKANLDTHRILAKSDLIPQFSDDDYSEFEELDNSERIPYPYRQSYAGRSSGLSILLFADLDEYNCTNTDSEGFLISLNLPIDFPRMRDNSIAIPSGSEVFINIKPSLTIPDESIGKLDIEKRKCYLGNEFLLKYYEKYTTSNCIDECIANWTLRDCDCVQYYMPRSSNETVCPPRKYACTETVRKQIIHKGLKKKCRHCQPTCSDMEYSSETTFLKIKNSTMDKLAQGGKFDNKKMQPRDISIVHLYFGDDSTYPRQRKEIFGTIELLSNAGGLLSLFIGFSVVNLLKFLYDFIINFFCVPTTVERSEEEHEHSKVKMATLSLSPSFSLTPLELEVLASKNLNNGCSCINKTSVTTTPRTMLPLRINVHET